MSLSFDEFFFTHVFFVFLRFFFRVSVSAFELTDGVVVSVVLLGSSNKVSSFSSLVCRLIHLFSIVFSYSVYLFTFPLAYNLFSTTFDFHDRFITSIISSLVPAPALLLLLEKAVVNLFALFFLRLSLLLSSEVSIEIGVLPILVLALFFFRDKSSVLYLYQDIPTELFLHLNYQLITPPFSCSHINCIDLFQSLKSLKLRMRHPFYWQFWLLIPHVGHLVVKNSLRIRRISIVLVLRFEHEVAMSIL